MSKNLDPSILKLYNAASSAFGKWVPFPYQKRVFEDLFVRNKKYVFEEWSRGAGKTITALRACILAGLLYPNKSILYIAPTEKLAQEILADKLYEIPKDILDKIVLSQGIVKFKNGSRLYIRGSEGDAHIGKEPSFVVYDEFRAHNPRAHNVIAPTLRKKESRLLIISTPPRLDDVESGKADHYDRMVEFCKDQNPMVSFRQVSCYDSEALDPEFIEFEKKQYEVRGEYNEFLAEYELKRVRRRKNGYFKQFDKEYLIPTPQLLELIRKSPDIKYVTCLDCSGFKRWAVLFCALDLMQNKVFILDSITICPKKGRNHDENRLHREDAGMSIKSLWPKVTYKWQKWKPGSTHRDWHILWDSADVMWVDLVKDLFDPNISIEMVFKKKNVKHDGLNVIQELFTSNRLYIGESAGELIEELQSLEIDPKTNQPIKEFDDLTDCLRYIFMSYPTLTKLANARAEPLSFKSAEAYLQHMTQKHLDNKSDHPASDLLKDPSFGLIKDRGSILDDLML